MKKMIKLLSIGTLTSITSLQAVACSDDSQYKTFLADVNASREQHIAILGFLGSKDDTASQGLFDAFQFWQNSARETFNTWKGESAMKIAMNKANISDIALKSYLGAKHQTAQSSSDFWNDKSISWQRDIFSWVATNKSSSSFFNPRSFPTGVTGLDLNTLDKDKKPMFTTLPVIFCIVNGELYTAAQGWVDAGKTNIDTQISALQDIIYNNILQRAVPK